MKLFEIGVNLTEGIKVFHGTDAEFEKFDVNQIGSGDGRSLGGWGIYFSEDPEIPKQYITGKGKIKTYELSTYGDFFDLDDSLMNGGGDVILQGLNSTDIPEAEIDEFQHDYMEYQADVTNKQAYEWLTHVMGGEKGASLFLKGVGYDGNLFRDKTNPDVFNYSVYNVEIIKDSMENEMY